MTDRADYIGGNLVRFWALADFQRKRVECWPWLGSRREGYGRFRVNGRTVQAHRYIYEAQYGRIPANLEIDHLCRNRACVNTAHLEAVTHAENVRRGSLHNRLKTHCPQGHPYDETNTYYTPRAGANHGGRQCKTCVRARSLAGYHKRKAAVA